MSLTFFYSAHSIFQKLTFTETYAVNLGAFQDVYLTPQVSEGGHALWCMVCGALQLSQNNEPDVEGWAGCLRAPTTKPTHINLLSTP